MDVSLATIAGVLKRQRESPPLIPTSADDVAPPSDESVAHPKPKRVSYRETSSDSPVVIDLDREDDSPARPTVWTAAALSGHNDRVPRRGTLPPQEPIDTDDLPSRGAPFLIRDDTGLWMGSGVRLLLLLKQHCGGTPVRSFTATASGFLVRASSPADFAEAFLKVRHEAFPGLTLVVPKPRSRPHEVHLRGVPTCVQEAEALEYLRETHGEGVRAVRRLHAMTNGKIDRDRPQQRMVVSCADEQTAAHVAKSRLFGILVTRNSAPTELPQIAICWRCFAWGHRSATCKKARLCIRCGAPGHVGSECPNHPPNTPVTCLNCSGAHAPTYAGCPKRREAIRRLQMESAPRQGPVGQRPFAATTTDTRSYANVAAVLAAPTTQAGGVPVPVHNRFDALPVEPTPFSDEQVQVDATGPAPTLLSPSEDQIRRRELMKELAGRLRKQTTLIQEAETARDDARREKAALLTRAADNRHKAANRRVAVLRKQKRKMEAEQAAVQAAYQQTRPTRPAPSGEQPVPTCSSLLAPSAPAEPLTQRQPRTTQRTPATSAEPRTTESHPTDQDAWDTLRHVQQALSGLMALSGCFTDPAVALRYHSTVIESLLGLISVVGRHRH